MALIKCPECGKEISDKVSSCIHCGFPLSEIKTGTVVSNKQWEASFVNEDVTIGSPKQDPPPKMIKKKLFVIIGGITALVAVVAIILAITLGGGTNDDEEGLAFSLNDDKDSYSVYLTDTCKDRNIVIPNTHKGKPVTDIDFGFSRCNWIESITIGNNIEIIGSMKFQDCTSLERVVMGNSVTEIGNFAFEGCRSLTSITIPQFVESIGRYAFSGCTSLTSIEFEGTVWQWKQITKGDKWNQKVPATYVQCSDGTVPLN